MTKEVASHIENFEVGPTYRGFPQRVVDASGVSGHLDIGLRRQPDHPSYVAQRPEKTVDGGVESSPQLPQSFVPSSITTTAGCKAASSLIRIDQSKTALRFVIDDPDTPWTIGCRPSAVTTRLICASACAVSESPATTTLWLSWLPTPTAATTPAS